MTGAPWRTFGCAAVADQPRREDKAMTQRIVTVTVAHAGGGVSAHAIEDSDYNGKPAPVSIQSYDSLAGFLASHDVLDGTPIYRFDLTPWDAAREFAVSGPMVDVMLPAGVTRPWGRRPLTCNLGPLGLDYVSPEEYDRLARAAGIVVQTVGDPS